MASASAEIDRCMRLARAAEEGGRAEEARGHYASALEHDPALCEAWLGKARAAAACSTLLDPRLDDVSEAVARGGECAAPARRAGVRAEGARLLARAAADYHGKSKDRFLEFVQEERAWSEYTERCASVVRALEAAHALDPGEPTILQAIVDVCSEQVRGVVYTAVGDYWISRTKRHDVSRRYESQLRATIAACATEIEALAPDWKPPPLDRRAAEHAGTCFVATATMGDPNHPDVVALRELRDRVLERSAPGRALVRAYAVVGPAAAGALRRSPLMRYLSRVLLVKPLASMARALFLGSQ